MTKFADELRRAIKRRETTVYAVSRATDLDPSTIYGIAREGKVPRHDTAVKLAEHLSWDNLIKVAIEARTRTCPVCAKTFYSAHEKQKTYCGKPCRAVAINRRRRATAGNANAVVRHRLDEMQEAVAEFCKSCEPLRVCRDAACELRPVSPLPLIELTPASNRRRIA
jgi:ribosomal protein S27AE